MKRIIYILISALILCTASADAAKPRKTSGSVRQEKQKTERKIKETKEQIQAKNREITKSLNSLNLLNAEVRECALEISRLNQQLARLGNEIKVVEDSIAILDKRLADMRKSMTDALLETRSNRSTVGNLAFIFSAESFEQAFRRTQALKQFTKWRNRKAAEIESVKTLLDSRRERLDQLRKQSTEAVRLLSEKRKTLEIKQAQTEKLVDSLKKQEKYLNNVVKEQQAKASELDAELERIIAIEVKEAEEKARKEAEAREAAERAKREEAERIAREEAEKQKKEQAEKDKKGKKDKDKDKNKNKKGKGAKEETKPSQGDSGKKPEVKLDDNKGKVVTPAKSDEKLTGAFADNKGKLPHPIDGTYKIVKGFGRQKHPNLPHVETDNAGIDIQGAPGATVRAVFDGVVSAIVSNDTYHNIILVKHGDYITVYAGVGQLAVRKGDKVTRGQALGKVYIDKNDGDRSVLHFEIRHAVGPRNILKENPEIWLR